jgi:hypothetical protein
LQSDCKALSQSPAQEFLKYSSTRLTTIGNSSRPNF